MLGVSTPSPIMNPTPMTTSTRSTRWYTSDAWGTRVFVCQTHGSAARVACRHPAPAAAQRLISHIQVTHTDRQTDMHTCKHKTHGRSMMTQPTCTRVRHPVGLHCTRKHDLRVVSYSGANAMSDGSGAVRSAGCASALCLLAAASVASVLVAAARSVTARLSARLSWA